MISAMKIKRRGFLFGLVFAALIPKWARPKLAVELIKEYKKHAAGVGLSGLGVKARGPQRMVHIVGSRVLVDPKNLQAYREKNL